MVLEIKLAQISLPRLEKINTSMFWESGILLQNERWISPKLYILHKMFSWYILNKQILHFKLNWVKCPFIKIKAYKLKSFYHTPKNKQHTVLGRYIFQFKNKHTTIILYTHSKDLKKGIRYLYRRILNQYNNKSTVKYYNKFITGK